MNITAGKFKGQKIAAPDERITRPTLSKVRMSVFNTLQAMIEFEGKSFLDMFSGSGIMALEALSRGFENSVFIEKDKKTFFALKENAEKLSLEPVFYKGDTLKILVLINQQFDVIYIDPPYREGLYEKTLNIIQQKSLLKPDGFIVLEHLKETMINFSEFNILKQKNYGEKSITILRN